MPNTQCPMLMHYLAPLLNVQSLNFTPHQIAFLSFIIMASPRFFQQPLRYLRWASHEKPAIFYSFIVGSLGPAMFVVGPTIRRWLGDDYERERVPMTYPSMLSLSPLRSSPAYSLSHTAADTPFPSSSWPKETSPGL